MIFSPMVKVVLLTITMSNANNGAVLFELAVDDFPLPLTVNGEPVDRIERCRKNGLAHVKRITPMIAEKFPKAAVTGNVDCEWVRIPKPGEEI